MKINKKGSTVTITDDKNGEPLKSPIEHTMVFTAVKNSGTHGGGAIWEGISDSDWRALFDNLQPLSTIQREAICRQLYDSSYQRLYVMFGKKKDGDALPMSTSGTKRRPAALTGLALARRIKEEIEVCKTNLEALEAELLTVQDDAKAELAEKFKKEMEELEKMG